MSIADYDKLYKVMVCGDRVGIKIKIKKADKLTRKICPAFEPNKNSNCKFNPINKYCWGESFKDSEKIRLDKDPNYFCPHSKEFIEEDKKDQKHKDKWIKYWENKEK